MNEAAWWRRLKAFSATNVFNPWRQSDSLDIASGAAARRIERLKQHFDCRAAYVLIGEASGYQGCHFSGIPFTSERLLLEGAIPRVACMQRFSARPRPWSEPSATTVWATLDSLGIARFTVLWNAFPWHPHRTSMPYSNRRPTDAETRHGAHILAGVLERYEGATVVAVGQVARQSLRVAVGSEPLTVRHPSMAGVREFRANLAAIVRSRSKC